MGDEKNTDTPFNFAMLFYASLNELCNRKDRAAIEGDLWGWYQGLKAIKRRISFKITKQNDKEFFKTEFNKVKDLLSHRPPREVAEDYFRMANSDAIEKMEDIDEKLTSIMDKYHMIFPNIKGSKGLQDIRELLKLGKPIGGN